MSVLIKNMAMPVSCFGCPFFIQENYWNKDNETDILSKCKRTGEFTWESVNGYLPNCPLVPIQPHGDLIDRDVLTINTAVPLDGKPYRYVHIDNIENAPVIISADESDMDSFIHIFEEDDEEDEMDSFIHIFKD